METNCLFCLIPKERIILENDNFIAVLDKYPKQEGHTLIISKRHFSSIFVMSEDEMPDFLLMLQQVKSYLDGKYMPDGFNMGTNVGEVAGQSVMHFHFHVIPRYERDRLGHFFG
jgi:diadenosine tetraphosphate (Ap4A) HIT family hydrolase